jgi:hypothetical protein
MVKFSHRITFFSLAGGRFINRTNCHCHAGATNLEFKTIENEQHKHNHRYAKDFLKPLSYC